MTDQEALDIYQAGQDLLAALHPFYSDDALDNFNSQLSAFYDFAGLEHGLCDDCYADCPKQLLTKGVCVVCLFKEG